MKTNNLGFGFEIWLQINLNVSKLGLADGKLVRWTKGFNCDGVEGENVVELLEAALARRDDVQIDICAILNDTTGSFYI